MQSLTLQARELEDLGILLHWTLFWNKPGCGCQKTANPKSRGPVTPTRPSQIHSFPQLQRNTPLFRAASVSFTPEWDNGFELLIRCSETSNKYDILL
jgi:hypothetical protein